MESVDTQDRIIEDIRSTNVVHMVHERARTIGVRNCTGPSKAKVLLQIETASLKKQGEEITDKQEAELFNKIKSRYDQQISPYYAASRLWTDAIIDPLETRKWISMGIEAANNSPIDKQFNMGVLQV